MTNILFQVDNATVYDQKILHVQMTTIIIIFVDFANTISIT